MMHAGENPLQRRARAAAAALSERGLEAMLLGPGADQYYLTGFEHHHAGERLLALVLRADGAATWICPAMNVPQVEACLAPEHSVLAWTDAEGYAGALRRALDGMSRLAFDDELRAGFLLDLLALKPGARVAPASAVMRGLRARKDAEELAQLRAAARSTDATISEAVALCRPGETEDAVDGALRDALRRACPEGGVAFTIVAGGPNSALPHHETGRRALEPGDVVVLDFGTRRYGYHSDITVTCSVGEPADPEFPRVYRAVWEAQQRALEAIRPGVPAEAIDRAARESLDAAGYGEYFLHRTGHGLGLQLHEPPYLVAGNPEPLDVGMVFSVEPGVYLPGRFGVRLEVIVSVVADGVSLLNAPSAPEPPRSG